MILPGISGSFILILMGNYELIVLEAINQFKLPILVPFMAGCAIGLIIFSHILSWILKKSKHQTIATLTGFICGSLVTIWPWKNTIYKMNNVGEPLMKDGKQVIFKYQLAWPEALNSEVLIAILIMIIGIVSIWITETIAAKSKE
jgi:putative membrane protein